MKTFYYSIFRIIIVLVISVFSIPTFGNSYISNLPYFYTSGENENLSVKKMYPNPVKDKLTVEFQVQTAGDLQIKVFDILGNEVVKKDIYLSNSGFNRIIFDLSDLRPGIYIMKAVKDTCAVSVRVKKQ